MAERLTDKEIEIAERLVEADDWSDDDIGEAACVLGRCLAELRERWAECARLKRERDDARRAFDQLRHDVDGYDLTFDHARWLAEGTPGEFDQWCERYEKEEWTPWSE